MARLVLLAIDLVAVSLLVFGLYFPRHRRRDPVVAYLGINVVGDHPRAFRTYRRRVVVLDSAFTEDAWRPGRAGGAAR
jgi:hypothetical protein